MFTANLARDMPAPPEVDAVLAAIRATPIIVRDFPDIKMTQLRVNKIADTGLKVKSATSDPANFVVTCLPKSASKSGGAGGGGGSGGGATSLEGGKVAKTE